MDNFMNNLLDKSSDFLARKPGFLPLLAVVLILLNLLLQIFPGSDYWLVSSNLFLHIGVITGLIGILMVRALG
jgi:low affinity Fe/Cu permease